jgi:basic membrane protein A
MSRVVVVLFGPRGQGGFNEAGAAGAQRAAAGGPVEIAWVEPPASRIDAVAALAATSPALIVLHGGQGEAPAAAVAPRFARVAFAVTQGSVPGANVACYQVRQEQSAFLAGVLAAADTATGTVAHLSGERVRPGLEGRAAYADGVAREAPAVRLLSTFCGDQHDAALAERVVAAQAAAGADRLFAMIDGGRAGAIRACRTHGVRQIGNVFDWTQREPDVFVASAVADSGVCVAQAIADHRAGALALGALVRVGLECTEAVRLALHPSVRPAVRARVDHWAQRLLDGRVEPSATFDDAAEFVPRGA